MGSLGEVLLVAGCAVAAAPVGSCVDAVVRRVPAGASLLAAVSAADLPSQRGAGRDSAEPGGRRRALAVTAVTAVLFAATAAWFGPVWHLPAFLYLVAVAVALTVIDLAVHRLPDAVVLPSYLVSGALLLAASAATGDGSSLVRAVVGMAGLYVVYLVLALARPGGMGFGDVKLAGLLGMYLGWLGYAELVVGGLAGFVLGGVAGAALLAVRRAGRRSTIAFGPFMLLGAACGVVLGEPVASWYLGAAGL